MVKSAIESRRILDALVDRSEAPPAGWRTAHEWGVQCGLSRRRMSERLYDLIEHGHAECRNILIRTPAGAMRSIPHYRIPALE